MNRKRGVKRWHFFFYGTLGRLNRRANGVERIAYFRTHIRTWAIRLKMLPREFADNFVMRKTIKILTRRQNGVTIKNVKTDTVSKRKENSYASGIDRTNKCQKRRNYKCM